MAKKQTSVRVDPADINTILVMVEREEVSDLSEYVRTAVKEKLNPNRISCELSPEIVHEIRRVVETGMYDSEEAFLREAVQRLLYLTKDKAAVRDALLEVVLRDPKFKSAMREYIHEVFVEGFRPPPKPESPPG